MVSDEIYDRCLPILQDATKQEEDKTDLLEDLIKRETELKGISLENAVLDVLWRFRDAAAPSSTAGSAARHIIVRRPSPASWQLPRSATPLASSPISGISLAPPPGLSRVKSSTASPFTSPRPSPRLAFASPRIPHSPDLNAYEFPVETTPAADVSGESVTETVDWLVNDDAASLASSVGATPGYEHAWNPMGATPFQPQQVDMGPYDILRSVVGEGKTDEEIERALEANGYDLTAAIMELMGEPSAGLQPAGEVMTGSPGTILVGKSMAVNAPTPVLATAPPPSQQRNGIVCKYFLSSGSCLRADCRFSHEPSNHICKYWMMGNCLAGDTCAFSHDPSSLVSKLSVEDRSMYNGSPPANHVLPDFQIQDYNSFPALQQIPLNQWTAAYGRQLDGPTSYGGPRLLAGSPGSLGQSSFLDAVPPKRPRSRPNSRHSRAATPSIPSVDDPDAFPTLGSSGPPGGKTQTGKRAGHGAREKDATPNTLAGIVRMAPSPSPSHSRPTSKAGNRHAANGRENSAAAQAIPAPQQIPWLETGEKANRAYLKARQEAIRHGALRNKFLQSAAQAWNRNDARAAKTLSLRGQSENELMRQAHREAARQLFDERNSSSSSSRHEQFVDLHGLHPAEAIDYLDRALAEYRVKDESSPSVPLTSSSSSSSPNKAYIYVVIGTGHHSKHGKDKLGRAARGYLNDWGYAYREFSVPGDRNGAGGILGVDVRSAEKKEKEKDHNAKGKNGVGGSNVVSRSRSTDRGGIGDHRDHRDHSRGRRQEHMDNDDDDNDDDEYDPPTTTTTKPHQPGSNAKIRILTREEVMLGQ